jgi:hypothetical protein
LDFDPEETVGIRDCEPLKRNVVSFDTDCRTGTTLSFDSRIGVRFDRDADIDSYGIVRCGVRHDEGIAIARAVDRILKRVTATGDGRRYGCCSADTPEAKGDNGCAGTKASEYPTPIEFCFQFVESRWLVIAG